MKDIRRNTILIILAGLLGAGFVLFLFFYLRVNRNFHDIHYQITPILRRNFVLNTVLIKTFNLLPVVIIFVYLISFSFIFTLGRFQEVSFHFSDIATPSYIILLIFLAINIFLQLITIPQLQLKTTIDDYNAKICYKAYYRAQELKKQMKYDKALDTVNIIFKFESSNKKALSLYDQINKEHFSSEIRGKSKYSTIGKELSVSPPEVFFERGKIEYQKKNYYAALFYFERALKLHKNNKELQELYRRCKARVEKELGTLTTKQEERKKLIKTKERGLYYLNQKNYYKAYAIFHYLHKKYPKLEDIELYMKTAEKKLAKIDFLPSELENYRWLPGWNNIIFIDKDGYINTIKKAIFFNNNYYFYDIKRYRVNTKATKMILQFKYGKWINNGIRLKNRSGYYEIKQKDIKKYVITPYVYPWYLVNSSNIKGLQSQLTIYNIFSLSEVLRKSGFDIPSKYQWLSIKLGIFFGLYILTMLVSGFGWANRSIYEFPPIFKLLMFIIVSPVISYYLYMIFLDFNKIIMYTYKYFHRFIIKSPTFNIFIYILIIQLFISLISSVYFLSQKTE